MKKLRSIRFSAELDASIAKEALLDHRGYSDEVRELLRLGLERAQRIRAARETAATVEEARVRG